MNDPVFGIEKLDEDLNGIPDKSIVIFSASPAVGNEVFGYQVIHNNLIKNKKILLFLNRTSPASYMTEMKEYDFNVSDNLEILDAYSNITGIQQQGGKNISIIQNPADKQEIYDKLRAEIAKGYDLLVVDSLSLLVDQFDFDTVYNIIDMIKSETQKSKGSTVLLFTEWDYDKNYIERLFSKTNAVIDIKGVEKRVIFGQYFAVIKCDWLKEPSKMTSALFKTLKPGGVKLYIPKILVTGPTDAGKSSFIHSACPDAVSVDRLGGTIALDHGSLDFKGYVADMFGTPGQERFDPLLKLLGGEAIGVILVVDATRPEGFPRAIEMLRKTEAYGLPIVVVANKYNLPGALSIDEIKEKLHLERNAPITPTTAVDLSKIDPNEPTQLKKEEVEKALSLLFEQLR